MPALYPKNAERAWPWLLSVTTLVVLLGQAATAQQDATPVPATNPSTRPAFTDYAAIIADLDHDVPAARRAASLRLNSMGGDALPFVRKALEAGDISPEALGRLKRALPLLEARHRRQQRELQAGQFMSNAVKTAYFQAGGDPRWDAIALDALERYRVRRYVGKTEQLETADLFRQGYDAGCRNDAFMVAYEGVIKGETHLYPKSAMSTIGPQIQKYLGTDIVPAWKLLLHTRDVSRRPSQMVQTATTCVDCVRQMLADPSTPAGFADEMAMAYLNALRGYRSPEADRAAEVFLAGYLELKPLDRAGRHITAADHAIKMAWKARGGGWANSVTPAGWKGFQDWLTEAERHLEAAWKIDPDEPRAGELMITVCMGLGGDRQKMETWYDRSLKADPDHFDAAARRLYFLYPRWHGSHQEMVDFGRQCLATENWRGGIPFTLVFAHDAIASEVGEKEYFLKPEVWNDIQRVYEGYLLNAPNDIARRTQLARFATRAERWAEAHEQFQILADHADFATFGGKPTYDYFKRKAARLAKVPAATPPN